MPAIGSRASHEEESSLDGSSAENTEQQRQSELDETDDEPKPGETSDEQSKPDNQQHYAQKGEPPQGFVLRIASLI